MEYRQNANWNEDEHPRDDDGKFAKKGQTELSKHDYAVVCHARAEKYAQQRRSGKIPRRDYVYTKDYFVVYNNRGRDNFVVTKVIPIEGNEALISRTIEELEDG